MDKNAYGYSITIQLEDKPCLVVGGGSVAARKTAGLLHAHAHVTVCSPELVPSLAALYAEKAFKWRKAMFQSGDTESYFLVIAATDNDAVNCEIAAEAKTRGKLVNVATSPETGNFHVPASVAYGDLLLTVSTSGKSPALARLIRQELSLLYGEEVNRFLQFLEEERLRLKKTGSASKEREHFWRTLLRPEWLAAVRAGKREEIEGKIRDAVSSFRIKP